MQPGEAHRRRKSLKEGACFKATRVECCRVEGEHLTVMADEIHAVVDPTDDFFASSLPSLLPNSKIRKTIHRKSRASCEERKIMEASPFTITPPPHKYLGLYKTSNGSTIVDVAKGTRRTAYFPPMAVSSNAVFRETSAVEVIFGLDPTVGHPWVSPMALRHIRCTREEIVRAGGICVADFDTSESGWARFRTLYVCPAPGRNMYFQEWKVKQSALECCGQHRVVLPLSLDGGRVFRHRFSSSRTEIADPVLFKSLFSILEL